MLKTKNQMDQTFWNVKIKMIFCMDDI